MHDPDLVIRARGLSKRFGQLNAVDGLDLDFVPGLARPLSTPTGAKPIAISNSFGFGGHNAVLVLEAA